VRQPQAGATVGAALSALNKLRNRFRRRLTPDEVQRLEKRSRTRARFEMARRRRLQ
jgi:hypothetical protein